MIGLELTFSNSVNIYSLWISHAWAVCLHLLWKIINPSLDWIDIVSKLHNLSVQFTSQILDFKLAINSSWIYELFQPNSTSRLYWRFCLSFFWSRSVSSKDFHFNFGHKSGHRQDLKSKILRVLEQIGPSRNGGHGNDGLTPEQLYLAGSFTWFQPETFRNRGHFGPSWRSLRILKNLN